MATTGRHSAPVRDPSGPPGSRAEDGRSAGRVTGLLLKTAAVSAVSSLFHGYDTGVRGLRRPWTRPALVVGCGSAIRTQLSGIEMTS